MTVKYLLWCVVFSIFFKNGLNKSPFDIFIGGIFDVDQDEQEHAFKHAIQIINEEKFLFPNNLVSLTERVRKDNEFQVSKTVCSMLSKGVFGIFGPSSKTSSDHVQSICDTKEIPHIEMMWNNNQQRVSCLVNVYPYQPTLSYVFVDLIKELGWKKFTILYENDDSLKRISPVIKMSKLTDYVISFKQLDVTNSGNYRPALTDVKKSDETYFLLDCSIQILEDILKQAMQVGLMSDHHHYIITNLDLHTIDLFPYQHGGANITGVQLVNPKDERVKRVSNNLYFKKQLVRPTQVKIPHPEIKFRVETALIYDAVRLFSEAIQELSISKHLDSKILYCNDSKSWEHGYSIINYMRTQNSRKGLTGSVKLDNQGFRSDFMLNILELTTLGIKNIGKWNSTQGLRISRPVLYSGGENYEDNLHNRSFRVLIALSKPYNMFKKTSAKHIGNDRFEGYGIDLIHELSLLLGFNYTFKLQEDGNYGIKNLTTGEWNGMIRELLDENADLAITDLTITSEREEAVDFTSPFMNLGISILYKKPMKLPPRLFSFMSPFSAQVWYYLGGAYVGVSLTLYLLARLSPAEWTNRYPCIDEPQFLENQFSIRNCFWFTLGSLMQQGSELAPIAISTRMVAGTWWFFTLIMVSSYTANLAAFLTVESLYSPFKTIEELANQNVIKFGAKRDGATSHFFRVRNSTYSTYQKIWKFMESNPDVMTESNPEGVRRAENENYAFLMESTTIDYTTERHCNLTQIGRLLDDKGYGIAMRKNMSYRHALSTAVLKLQESGKLGHLKQKWWKERRGGGLCTATEVSGDKKELDFDNVGGVFFVLVVGSAAGLLVGIAEMMVDILNTSWQRKTSFRRELEEELAFLFQLKNKTKKIHIMRSRAASKDFTDFKFQNNMG